MHELSLASEVIELAHKEAIKNKVTVIREILVEIGTLSGVEADAFELAMELAVKNSILENSVLRIIRTPGKGKCNTCDHEFEVVQLPVICPECNGYAVEINSGNAFRVVSLTVD